MRSLATYSEGSPGGGGEGGGSPGAASPAPSSASMEVAGAEFSAFIREVAARVIQHYARAWLAPKPSYQVGTDYFSVTPFIGPQGAHLVSIGEHSQPT